MFSASCLCSGDPDVPTNRPATHRGRSNLPPPPASILQTNRCVSRRRLAEDRVEPVDNDANAIERRRSSPGAGLCGRQLRCFCIDLRMPRRSHEIDRFTTIWATSRTPRIRCRKRFSSVETAQILFSDPAEGASVNGGGTNGSSKRATGFWPSLLVVEPSFGSASIVRVKKLDTQDVFCRHEVSLAAPCPTAVDTGSLSPG